MKNKCLFWGKILFCILCFAFFFKIFPTETWKDLKKINLTFFFPLVGILILTTFLSSLRLLLLLRPFFPELSFINLLFSTFVSSFVAFFMPIAVAGDISRFFWLFNRIKHNQNSALLLSGMAFDRIISLASTIMLFSATSIWVYSLLPIDFFSTLWGKLPFLALFVIVATALGLVTVYILRNHTVVTQTRQALTYWTRHPLPVLASVALALAVSILGNILLYITAIWVVGAELPLEAAFFVGQASALLSLIPLTPGGLGFMEVSQTGLLVWFSYPIEKAVQTVILLRITAILASLPGGVFLFLAPRHNTTVAN